MKDRPLDVALRERLNLRHESAACLQVVRAMLKLVDAASRATLRSPFFAYNESESVLAQLGGLKGHALVRALLSRDGGTRLITHGLDHIPATGPVVIAATHPTGMFDFLAHAGAVMEKRPDLKVVANQEVEVFLGPEIIVPVRIDSKNRALSANATQRAMQQHLGDGGALLIFGSGRVPHLRNGHLTEPAWKQGATRASQLCHAPIVPAALDARNSRLYYRTRATAQFVSGGSDDFGAMIGSLRYMAEFLDKLGGLYNVHYDAPLPAGSEPDVIQSRAENLVPGLYAPG
jgi:hypothetical protein